MALSVGDKAPDFTLVNQNGEDVKLADYIGKQNVVLVFYPLDFSPVCTKEHACFVQDLGKFNNLNAQVFGISVDSKWAHKAFAEKMGISYPLLADFQPRGAVAAKYGVFLEDKGITQRVNFVIDKEGKIAAVQENEIPDVPELEPLQKTLQELG